MKTIYYVQYKAKQCEGKRCEAESEHDYVLQYALVTVTREVGLVWGASKSVMLGYMG